MIKTKLIKALVDPNTYTQFKRYCDRHQVSQSSVIRTLILDLLAKQT